jgi:hypothetical protein
MSVNINIFDPLEQFDVVNYCTWSSNIAAFMLILFLIFIFSFKRFPDFYLLSNKNYFIKKLLHFVKFIINKRHTLFLMLLILLCIWIAKTLGLLPYTASVIIFDYRDRGWPPLLKLLGQIIALGLVGGGILILIIWLCA